MQRLQAIETIYQGYRFRSRLEARWAVFFDALGVPYQYEVEGFDLDGTWYLPDFWLPKHRAWVEIKPPSGHYYRDEYFRLAMRSHAPLINICGDPWPRAYSIVFYEEHPDGGGVWFRESSSEAPIQFAVGRQHPQELWIYSEDLGATCLNSIGDDDRWPVVDAVSLQRAYRAARQARFERH